MPHSHLHSNMLRCTNVAVAALGTNTRLENAIARDKKSGLTLTQHIYNIIATPTHHSLLLFSSPPFFLNYWKIIIIKERKEQFCPFNSSINRVADSETKKTFQLLRFWTKTSHQGQISLSVSQSNLYYCVTKEYRSI